MTRNERRRGLKKSRVELTYDELEEVERALAIKLSMECCKSSVHTEPSRRPSLVRALAEVQGARRW